MANLSMQEQINLILFKLTNLTTSVNELAKEVHERTKESS